MTTGDYVWIIIGVIVLAALVWTGVRHRKKRKKGYRRGLDQM